MQEVNRYRLSLLVRALPVLLAVAAVAAGCASSSAPRKTPIHMEIQEEVGFVITEEARIDAADRAGYEEAVRLLELGRTDQGMELLAQAAEQVPDLSAPRIDLGIAHHRAGNLKAAEEQLKMALAINPNHPVVHNELGIIYRKTGRFAEARESYEAALAIYPGFHYARRNLAILCDLYLVDKQCALEQYAAYMKTAPDDEEVEMWLTDIRNRMNR